MVSASGRRSGTASANASASLLVGGIRRASPTATGTWSLSASARPTASASETRTATERGSASVTASARVSGNMNGSLLVSGSGTASVTESASATVRVTASGIVIAAVSASEVVSGNVSGTGRGTVGGTASWTAIESGTVSESRKRPSRTAIASCSRLSATGSARPAPVSTQLVLPSQQTVPASTQLHLPMAVLGPSLWTTSVQQRLQSRHPRLLCHRLATWRPASRSLKSAVSAAAPAARGAQGARGAPGVARVSGPENARSRENGAGSAQGIANGSRSIAGIASAGDESRRRGTVLVACAAGRVAPREATSETLAVTGPARTVIVRTEVASGTAKATASAAKIATGADQARMRGRAVLARGWPTRNLCSRLCPRALPLPWACRWAPCRWAARSTWQARACRWDNREDQRVRPPRPLESPTFRSVRTTTAARAARAGKGTSGLAIGSAPTVASTTLQGGLPV
mmetsp:Transcript_27182/g.74769  ORF Transcript_27182/g.74769 Transcript_27182/m.74769 type:complete len:462 (+) Transcript_27182:72-1457(+)